MITPLGSIYACIYLIPIGLLLLIGFIWLRSIDGVKQAIAKHKKNKRTKQRKAQLADLLKEEHEWWLKLNEPEAPLSKKEIEHYASECQTLRDEIFSLSLSEAPFLEYDLPLLSKDGYKFVTCSMPSDDKAKLMLLNG